MVEQKMFDSSSPHKFASERTELDRDVAELSCLAYTSWSVRIGWKSLEWLKGCPIHSPGTLPNGKILINFEIKNG